MSYLDYLATHDYEQLPPHVREEIAESEYTARRRLVIDLKSADTTLPPALREAYRAAVSKRKTPTRLPMWLLAASWLLTLLVGGAWLLQDPVTVTEYVQLPPEIQTRTVTEVRTDTIERLVYRTRLRTDTVFAPAPAPTSRLVVVRDTVYRDMNTGEVPARSVPLNTASLGLLVSSRAD
jgi:hypothetical protein